MKNFLFIILVLFTQNIFANNCVYSWDLVARGLTVGSMKDNILQNNNAYSINSTFTPTSWAKILGAPIVEREAQIKNGSTTKRKEHLFNKNNDTYIWEKNTLGQWDRTVNTEITNNIEINDNIIIDSTSFPYLFVTKSLPDNFTSSSTSVLSKSDSYVAMLSFSKISSEQYKLEFSNKNKKGILILDENKNPINFTFYDGNETLTGNLKSKTCQ